MALRKHTDKSQKLAAPQPETAPGARVERVEVRHTGLLTRFLLLALPVVAIALMALVIYLIVMMPKDQSARLERYSEVLSSRLASAEQRAAATTAEPDAALSVRSLSPQKSRDIDPTSIVKLVTTGVGLDTRPRAMQAPLQQPAAGSVWVPQEAPRFLSYQLPAAAEIPSEQAPGENTESIAETAETTAPTVDPELDLRPASDADADADTMEVAEVVEQQDSAAQDSFVLSQTDRWVLGDVVNLRADASTASEIKTVVHAGDYAYEVSTNGSWSYVALLDGTEGYILSNLLSYSYVAPQASPEENAETGDVEAGEGSPESVEEAPQNNGFEPYYATLYSQNSGVNIRSGPSLDSEVIGSLYMGESIDVQAYSGGWFAVDYNGATAYVNGEYLSEEPVQTEEGPSAESWSTDYPGESEIYTPSVDLAGGSAVVSLASQFVGYPYVFGGASPSGFDCSGFCQYIFGQLGYGISRTTYTQVNDGIPVPFSYMDYSNLVPGDLLLFAEGSDVFHAGLYVGGGQMIHAANPSLGVIYSKLTEDFYASRLAYVRRIIY